jgi:hypothetical protein
MHTSSKTGEISGVLELAQESLRVRVQRVGRVKPRNEHVRVERDVSDRDRAQAHITLK